MKPWATKDVLHKIHSDNWSGAEAAALNDWFNRTSLDEIKHLDVPILQELVQLLGMPIEYPSISVEKLDDLRIYINEQMDKLLQQDDIRSMLIRLRDR